MTSFSSIPANSAVTFYRNAISNKMDAFVEKSDESGNKVRQEVDTLELTGDIRIDQQRAYDTYRQQSNFKETDDEGVQTLIVSPVSPLDMWEMNKNRPTFKDGSSSPIQDEPYYHLQQKLLLAGVYPGETILANPGESQKIETPEIKAAREAADVNTKEQMKETTQKIVDYLGTKDKKPVTKVSMGYNYNTNEFMMYFNDMFWGKDSLSKAYDNAMKEDKTFARMVSQLDSLMQSLNGKDKKIEFCL